MKWTVEHIRHQGFSEREKISIYRSADGRFMIHATPRQEFNSRRASTVTIGREYLVTDSKGRSSATYHTLNDAKEWAMWQCGLRRDPKTFPYRFRIIGTVPSARDLKTLLNPGKEWIDWRMEVQCRPPHQTGNSNVVYWFAQDTVAVAFRMHFPEAAIERAESSTA